MLHLIKLPVFSIYFRFCIFYISVFIYFLLQTFKGRKKIEIPELLMRLIISQDKHRNYSFI